MLFFSIPFVQTQIAKQVTSSVNNDFGTNMLVKKVDLSLLGSVTLKEIEIRDHHKDTLIFVKKLRTSLLSAKSVLDNKLQLRSASLDGVYFYLKKYKGEETDNLSIFISQLDSGPVTDSVSTPFILKSSNFYLSNTNFKSIDENRGIGLEYAAYEGGGNIQDFNLIGPDLSAKIRGFYFVDNKDLKITNFTSDFTYSKTGMTFLNTNIKTLYSDLNADIQFDYEEGGLGNFIDLVNIKANFKRSKLSILDLKKLYTELSGNDLFTFTTKIEGSLNNFSANDIRLTSRNGIRTFADITFINSISDEEGFILAGNFKEVTADYSKLKRILPNVLGENLPSELSRLGSFSLEGIAKLTPRNIEADLSVDSDVGQVNADLEIIDFSDIDNASYKGDVEFDLFDMGIFFDDKSLGKFSFKGKVDGSGFKIENINTTLFGKSSLFEFNNYSYQKIDVDGNYQNSLFEGRLLINDANLQGKFDGLADLGDDIRKFDFRAQIDFVDLNAINFSKRDSLSILKGNIALDADGNSFDDAIGKAVFTDVSYTNAKKEYLFKEFVVNSSSKDSIKTISVDSKDIVKGELSGKFTFSELGRLAQNALGSYYSNYKPYEVDANQYVDFNFTIYNQIIDVFLPEIEVSENTRIAGNIAGKDNRIKFNVRSPKIIAYGNTIDSLILRSDNKNRFYNSILTANEVTSDYFNLKKLNLINRKANDTLFFKSIFKGGKESREDFNLDFYYTINKEEKSVVGLEKSVLNYKDYTWVVNKNNDNEHKLTFDLNTDEYIFSPFLLKSDAQEVKFKGVIRDSTYTRIETNMTNVLVESFLPPVDSLKLRGVLNGNIDFLKENEKFTPKGNLIVKDFYINDFKQGDLALNVTGKGSLTKYDVSLSLDRENVKSIAAIGEIDFTEERPIIDLDLFLEDFKLNAFSPLGQDVLSKIRGSASGNVNLSGFLRNPNMQGSLTLENAGLKFPYLNTDYDFKGDATIDLNEQSFIFQDIQLEDVKYKTLGNLNGSITHKNFNDWFLNLDISSDNLLILDTEDSEEATYYGTGFIDGSASITGLTNSITIDVNAKTMPNTIFVIPLKDIATVDNYKLIHFKSEKTAAERQEELALEAIKGVDLKIDLEVTTDAIAQIVIDEVNGSELKGSGTGDLDIRINTRGTFNMFGDYTIDNGFYNFKYGGVINKPFEIVKGSTVSWSGSPYEANLNVTAVYTTNANPAVLLENFNTNRKIPVNLVTKISGSLFNSKQDFDIEIPNANSTISSELDFILNDNNINAKMRQFFSLLALGSFIAPETSTVTSSEIITGTTSNIIGSVLSDIISSKDGKLQLGLNYTAGNQQNNLDNLITDDQVDVSLTTQISDRVIINGKVGVPVGTQTQSSVVGEVKVEVLLNEAGNFRGVIFNRQNEIQYSTQEEGYTQGVGLTYEVNFNTLSELLRKLGIKSKKKAVRKKKDSILSPHKKLINFKNNQ